MTLASYTSALLQFQEKGYCVFDNFCNATQIRELKNQAENIVNAFDLERHKHVFSTTSGDSDRDDFFLNSGDKVRCFLEQDALDERGELTCDRAFAFNKIGHALHDLDPVFDRFSRAPTVAQVVSDLGLTQPQIWQSMYIFKPPRIGGEVQWHQDATYFYTQPVTVTTLWFALDDATVENGCLWVDGNGADTPLRERFVRRNNTVTTIPCDPTPWPDETDATPVEVSAGALVCFKGTLPHYSAPNRSDKPRHAYTLHITDGTSTYAPENWLQRDDRLPLRGF